VDTIVALLGTAVIGGVAFFFRSWANGLSDDIGELKEKIDTLEDKVDTAINELAQVKVVVGWPPQLRRAGH
jgi:outer membrane murein-binding lipoprotein Lpp